jgi:hypothetical protein
VQGGLYQPIVIPAGSYINAIFFDVQTPFGVPANLTGIVLNIFAYGAPGTTITPLGGTAVSLNSGIQIASCGNSSAITSFSIAQRNQIGSGSSFAFTSGTSNATEAAVQYLTNTGSTDTMIGVSFGFTVTTSAVSGAILTAGAGILGVNYCVRNPDGSWYPQTPPSTIANPPTATY